MSDEYKNKICCFSGHRPDKLLMDVDENGADFKKFIGILEAEIFSIIKKGCVHFITGMAMGADIWGAETVLRLKEKYPQKKIKLTAALPYQNQALNWNSAWKKRHSDILNVSDEIKIVCKEYTKSCMQQRNLYMIDISDLLIAVYSGKRGGTKFTLEKAKSKRMDIIIINPELLSVEYIYYNKHVAFG